MKEKEIERMLKPRFEVIADWPWPNDKETKVGDVILLEFNEQAKEYATVINSCYFSEKTIRKYPHLFRELKWWEKREASEMPKYFKENGIVYKVKKWTVNDNGWIVSSEAHIHYKDGILPATEAEYLEQKK